MFKAGEATTINSNQLLETTELYKIRPADIINIEVFSNEGERIIDPDLQLMKDLPVQAIQFRPTYRYVVESDGAVRLPQIGKVKVEGLNLREVEVILGEKYTEYYAGSFVVATALNRRVAVLGASGGKVVPLENELMSLSEVLALAGGIDNFGKANNIRLLRNDQAFVIDLSVIDGYEQNKLIVQPGDIVYIEPIRRPLSESVRDYGGIVSIATTVASLIILMVSLN